MILDAAWDAEGVTEIDTELPSGQNAKAKNNQRSMPGTMRSWLSSWGPQSLLLLLLLLARAAYTVSTAPLQHTNQRDQPAFLYWVLGIRGSS